MAQISFYHNPNSSKNLHKNEIEKFKKYFFRHQLEVKGTSTLQSLSQDIQNDINNGADYIVCAGGDGAINNIIQNLVFTDTRLIALPIGTANDFANEMGLTKNIHQILKVINTNSCKKIDTICVNGRHMVTNGGVGLACEVAATVDRLRKENRTFKRAMKFLGKQTYSLIYAQKVLTAPFRLKKIFIKSPHFPKLEKTVTTPMILINNQEFIANKFQVAPNTQNNDGLFNVTLFLHQNRHDFLKSTYQMMKGHYPHGDPNLISFETNQLELISLDDDPMAFFGDGEIFSSAMSYQITIAANSLNVGTYRDINLLCSSHSLDEIEYIQ